MKTFSVLAASLFLVVACNSGESTQVEENTQTQGSGSELGGQVDPENVNNPMTANDPNPDDPNLPVLSFEREMYEFPGTINEGESVTCSFKFTNTGKSDLIIADATAPCGCTVPTFPKEPIPPGGTGSIKVVYNSEGKGGGRHEKALTVVSNSIPKAKELRIVVNVIAKAQ